MRSAILLSLPLLLCAACNRPDGELVARLEERIAYQQETSAAEKESYERQLAELQAANSDLNAQLNEFHAAAETARAMTGAAGSLEDKLARSSRDLADCREALEAYRTGLEQAVGVLNANAIGAQIDAARSTAKTEAAGPADPSTVPVADQIEVPEPVTEFRGSHFEVRGEVANRSGELKAEGWIELWISANGMEVDRIQIPLIVPALETIRYEERVGDGRLDEPDPSIYRVYAKWVHDRWTVP